MTQLKITAYGWFMHRRPRKIVHYRLRAIIIVHNLWRVLETLKSTTDSGMCYRHTVVCEYDILSGKCYRHCYTLRANVEHSLYSATHYLESPSHSVEVLDTLWILLSSLRRVIQTLESVRDSLKIALQTLCRLCIVPQTVESTRGSLKSAVVFLESTNGSLGQTPWTVLQTSWTVIQTLLRVIHYL